MATTIVCPNCKTAFEPTDVMREELQKKLNEEALKWKKEKEDEYKNREAALQKQLDQKDADARKAMELERNKIAETVAVQTRMQLAGDYEMQLKMMKENLAENEEKLKTARVKELEFLKKQQELLNKEEELDIKLQTMLLEQRAALTETIRKEEAAKTTLKDSEYQMKLKEMEMRIDAQNKLVEEMKRKAEQGSMQLQGEAQELVLEQMLAAAFPFDLISEVGKGVRGADCIQTVRNNYGQECGKIIYESKRTQSFGGDWIEKLKADMRSQGADVAVIVTQVMPKDMDGFGEKDGVWICTYAEARAVVSVLRDLVIKVYNAAKSQENKGDKMTLLYNYLTSGEFSEQWKAIREGFMGMRISIQKERDAMEKLWKAREKQLDKVLLNAAHIRGSIEGISGMENVDLNLTGGDEGLMLE